MDFLKKIFIIFQKFPKNVINDLYQLSFQNYCSIVNISSYKKEQLKLHRSLLIGVKGGGQKQPSEHI